MTLLGPVISHILPSTENPLTQFKQIPLINNLTGFRVLHCQLLMCRFRVAILQPTDYPIDGGIIAPSLMDFRKCPQAIIINICETHRCNRCQHAVMSATIGAIFMPTLPYGNSTQTVCVDMLHILPIYNMLICHTILRKSCQSAPHHPLSLLKIK